MPHAHHTPRVSILVPAYNREEHLPACLDSALAQDFTDFEIVVVDNASTDRTWQVCSDYARRDPRIRIFRNGENIGPVRNWLRCAAESRGAFVKILFSDDMLAPGCLGRMVPMLDDPETAFAFCAVRLGPSPAHAHVEYALPRHQTLDQATFLNLILQHKAPLSPGTMLIRRADFLSCLRTDFPTTIPHRYAGHGAGPDAMIFILALETGRKAAHISEPLAYFRAHEGSISEGALKPEVVGSYRAVFSLYLKTHYPHAAYINYMAYSWLQLLRRTRCPPSPVRLLADHESAAPARDSLSLACAVVRVLWWHFTRDELPLIPARNR